MIPLSWRRFTLYAFWIIGIVLICVTIVFLTLYFMPHRTSKLQRAHISHLSYKESLTQFDTNKKQQISSKNFEKGCESQLYKHGKKTARAVVLFHGITACTKQHTVLAKVFFDAGYNVYVPLTPAHGTTKNPEAVADITPIQLTNYVSDAYSVAAGIGDTVGFVGISGGATLATWGAQYIDGVSRLLVLSPFYSVSENAAPHWQLPLLRSLYGMNLVPDEINQGFSTRALAKYLIVAENYHPDLSAKNLKHVAVVTSANDTQIDLNTAHYLPQRLAKNNSASFRQTRLAPELGIGHDIVGPYEKPVAKHQAQLNNLYLSFYENREPAKEL